MFAIEINNRFALCARIGSGDVESAALSDGQQSASRCPVRVAEKRETAPGTQSHTEAMAAAAASAAIGTRNSWPCSALYCIRQRGRAPHPTADSGAAVKDATTNRTRRMKLLPRRNRGSGAVGLRPLADGRQQKRSTRRRELRSGEGRRGTERQGSWNRIESNRSAVRSTSTMSEESRKHSARGCRRNN